jgi:hypothetical protein
MSSSLKEQAPKVKNSRGREERHLYLFTLLLREQWKSKTKLALNSFTEIQFKTEIQKRYLKLLKIQDEPLLPSQHGWHDCIDVVILNASRIFKIRQFFCTKLIPLCMATLTCL